MKRGSLEGVEPPCLPPSTPPPPPLPPATTALPPASPWKLVGGSVSRPAAAKRSAGENGAAYKVGAAVRADGLHAHRVLAPGIQPYNTHHGGHAPRHLHVLWEKLR
ncbi:hypothetical protein E2C01_068509 [Portunus trituberculatus]|uniref:Uncharacterized protein n=1 Tax=Portunus trituberculatus TaxID=210409 RepID=A0A5B7HP02_PORTR|nr:hypothetical protein [Portunus trituberculatus]